MYFTIYRSTNHQYYFTMHGDNHEKVGTSETYVQKQSAIHTINMIKREASVGPTYDKS